MSEEIKKVSLFDAFSQTAQTLEQAEAKAKAEKGFEKIDRFRTPDEGEYMVRVLPLAPVIDAEGNVTMPMDRQGCDFQLYQMFLDIDSPADKKGKIHTQHIPVIRATQKGVDKSIDLLDEYVRIAKDMYADDDEVINLLTDSQSRHRIRFSNTRVMYVYDVTNDVPKGPMLWQISNNQYKDIDTERRAVWLKEKNKRNGNPNCGDPMCSIEDAWPLTITRTGKGFNDTKYAFKIDRGEDKMPMAEDQMQALFDMPRIPDEIYHYTRYSMEATIEFLKQYDQKHDLDVCNDDEFKEAIEKLKGELAADDTSHFSLAGGKDAGGKVQEREVTIETLREQYDYIVDQNLGKDSSEYEELKEDIRQFIEDNQLEVVVKHSKKVSDLLDELEDAWEEKQTHGKKAEKPTDEKPAEEKDDNDEDGNGAGDNDGQDNGDDEERPVRTSRRRPARPSDDDEEEDTDASEGNKAEESAEVEEAPVSHRRRNRRA